MDLKLQSRHNDIIPVEIAHELNLWSPSTTESIVLSTVAGELEVPYYRRIVTLELVLSDRESKKLHVNVLVDPHVDEVLLSDYVASEFGIVLLDLKRDLWRLVDNPQDKVRESA